MYIEQNILKGKQMTTMPHVIKADAYTQLMVRIHEYDCSLHK